ncbi:TonB family protein [Pantoea sp. AS-PWVM4]|uniref:TonB family protein n=1 Tax=Pantoea sp. AS-PWVM4 TaxID=1332069 RepID=UPI00068643B9|nr:TonB family protein [Pantoea sp. AS-PWVM4]
MNKLCAVVAILILSNAASANSIKYPERAERLRINGIVDVLYDINKEGRAENIRVLNAEPKYVFEGSVRKDIGHWEFPPEKPQKDINLHIVFKAN